MRSGYSPPSSGPEEYELSPSGSGMDSQDEISDRDFHRGQTWHRSFVQRIQSWLPVKTTQYSALNNPASSGASAGEARSDIFASRDVKTRKRLLTRQCCIGLAFIPTLAALIVVLAAMIMPSYTHPPAHYLDLRQRALQSQEPGRANVNQEKVFIATSTLDKEGRLAGGHWGRALPELIDMLGPDNVFLSVYENDIEARSKTAIESFKEAVKCDFSIIAGYIDSSTLPHVILPDGSQQLKRIAYLADVRNRALQPLDDPTSPAYNMPFDKLLFINDIVFNPEDAANLLFSTNIDKSGKAQYRAACATDFVNPFKFYDTFATRDLEGNEMGLPFFPWFTRTGNADSRQDVLDQRDAVRVRSCWGGMVAFDAKWFQAERSEEALELEDLVDDHASTPTITTTTTAPQVEDTAAASTGDPIWFDDLPGNVDYHPEVDKNLNWHLDDDPYTASDDDAAIGSLPGSIPIAKPPNLDWATDTTEADSADTSSWDRDIAPRSDNTVALPLRFRASTDDFWDASECCLIHADLQAPRDRELSAPSGIYMNPYVRVAYTERTLRWLPVTRRFERLYVPFHRLLNQITGVPVANPRRTQEAGQEVTNRVWEYDDAGWMVSGNMSGRYKDVRRTALPGGFCGGRQLLVLGEGKEKGRWWFADVPRDNDR